MSNTINTTKTRILLKTASTAEWQESNLTPLPGEMCIYTDHYTKGEGDDATNYPGIKIGNGNTNVNQLPFITGDYPSTEDFEALKAFFTITDNSVTFNGSANKVNSNLVIKLNSGSTEGTNLFTFNGSTEKTINITPASINAMSIGVTIDGDTWS